ncbi:MAG: CotH kinase family protein [Bacteroidota bacterium]|nr:CotH kinase family protein [Bacteroidota bacterium]
MSQSTFYHTDTIREIRLYFSEPNWDYILDSLYVQGDKERILATIVIDGNQYDSVGVRYKGFSSVSVNYKKNPFNIRLDYIIGNQDHDGITKLKLSNGIYDPSFLREVLSYEIARQYMPVSEANYANLYINDTLWGLYTNTEAIDENFLNKHFDDDDAPFFKCVPENLNIQIGGENSNLSNTHGIDSTDYYDYYRIESDYGWHELYNLIDTLNNFSDSIQHSLNVDRTLWMHAFNYALINFDSYIGYGQNYYLYKDKSRKFSPIIWDLNMSFGGFRLTDASQLYFNGFDINQAQNIDPLTHFNYMSLSPRPLMRNIFNNPRYRRMYMAHIRTIIEENFANQNYFSRAQFLHNLIDASVQNDSIKFYSYSDFTTNITNQVTLPTTICPGISQLMNSRTNYLSNYLGYNGEPQITNIISSPQTLVLGSDIWITADVVDATDVLLGYRFGEYNSFKKIQMYDDGNHNDGLAGDKKYGAKIENSSNIVQYYLYAENDSAGSFSPERAEYEYYTISSPIQSGDLRINEMMADNQTTVVDGNGDYDDWIELYNTTQTPIAINNLYLSDNLSNILKWRLPNHVIPAGGYYIIWADEDGRQGENHANFQLFASGETITLADENSAILETVTFSSQFTDLSYARIPNGTGPFTIATPTFNRNNNITNIQEDAHFVDIYPNPFYDKLYVKGISNIIISDVIGRIIYQGNPYNNIINTSNWREGVYFVNLGDKGKVKLIKVK